MNPNKKPLLATTNLFELAVEAGKKGPRHGPSPAQREMMQSGDLQGVIDSLTGKQRNFVEEYLKDLNGSAAIRRSAYQASPGNENRVAQELLAKPHIRFCVDGLIAQRAEHVSVTSDQVLKTILRTIDRSENGERYDANAILRACELLGRHLKMFTDKQEVSGPNGGPIETRDVDDNADQFDSLMNRLKERADAEH